MTSARRGFTFINLMVSVGVMAVIAGVTLVTLEPDDRARAVGAAQLLAADLEYAQALSLASPGDPAMLNIDTANDGYWIAMSSDPDTAILRPNGEPYIVILGEGGAASFAGIDLAIVSGATGDSVSYDALGRLSELTDAVLSMTLEDQRADVSVSASTGFVTIATVDVP